MTFIALYVAASLKMTAIYYLIYSSDTPMVNPTFPEGLELFKEGRLTYVGEEVFASLGLALPRINHDAPLQCVRPPKT